MDFLARRVGGKVASPGADMLMMMLVLPRNLRGQELQLDENDPMTDRVCLLSRGSNGTYRIGTKALPI